MFGQGSLFWNPRVVFGTLLIFAAAALLLGGPGRAQWALLWGSCNSYHMHPLCLLQPLLPARGYPHRSLRPDPLWYAGFDS